MLRIMAATILAAVFSVAAQNEPEFKMTMYQVAFLKRGPAWTSEVTAETTKIQAGHMANISAMAKSGKLILAGPFEEQGDLRGMFVFKATAEEARQLAAQDPAVQAGRLVLEWHSWYSAEGITIVPGKSPPQKP